MSKTPMLDRIAAEEMLDHTGQIAKALKELEDYHKAALRPSLGLSLSLRCTTDGWALFYADGSSPEVMLPRGSSGYMNAEDAIQALREKVDGWIVQAEGEDAEPCTEAARKAGCTCTVPFAHSTSIDPPEPRVDRDCPLHGRRDPDAARERMRDDRGQS